MNVIQQQKRD